jgi:hypothetical protein
MPARRRQPTPPPRGATPDQLQEIKYRHILELQAVKRETLELREEKAYLVAQNLRLQRELSHVPSAAAAAKPASAIRVRNRVLLIGLDKLADSECPLTAPFN